MCRTCSFDSDDDEDLSDSAYHARCMNFQIPLPLTGRPPPPPKSKRPALTTFCAVSEYEEDIGEIAETAAQLTSGNEGHIVTHQLNRKRKPTSREPSKREINKLQKKNTSSEEMCQV